MTRRQRRKRKLAHDRRQRFERRTDSAAAVSAPAPAWHWREDRGALLEPERRGNELFISGMAAKAGILTYQNADGTETRELVTWETLRDSAAGLGRAPVTLEHPDHDVTPDNWSELGVGDVGDRIKVHEDTGYVQVQIAVRRADAITAIESGDKQELSPGYHAQIDPTPGVHPEFGAYDAVQTARRYNHLAIVEQARGGRAIRLRTDSASTARAIDVLSGPAPAPPPSPPPRGSHPPPPTPSPGARMRLSPWMIALCTRAGLDHRRYDSDEEAGKAVDAKLAEESHDTAPAPVPAHLSQDMVPAPSRDTGPTDDGETDDDENSGYADEDGNPLTKDQYIERLESALSEVLESRAKGDMEPLAKDMGIETKKGDSAADLALRIAEGFAGRPLTEQQRQDHGYVAALVDMARARHDSLRNDSTGAGREAGRHAWGDALTPEPRRDAAPPMGGGLGQTALNNWQTAFEASRGGNQ